MVRPKFEYSPKAIPAKVTMMTWATRMPATMPGKRKFAKILSKILHSSRILRELRKLNNCSITNTLKTYVNYPIHQIKIKITCRE